MNGKLPRESRTDFMLRLAGAVLANESRNNDMEWVEEVGVQIDSRATIVETHEFQNENDCEEKTLAELQPFADSCFTRSDGNVILKLASTNKSASKESVEIEISEQIQTETLVGDPNTLAARNEDRLQRIMDSEDDQSVYYDNESDEDFMPSSSLDENSSSSSVNSEIENQKNLTTNTELDEQEADESREQPSNSKRKEKSVESKRKESKRLRNLGKEYQSTKGKTVALRAIKPACLNCRQKCSTKITDQQRKHIHEAFWQQGDLQRQREFIARHMEEIKPKYSIKKLDSNRSLNYAYFLPIESKKVKVCKKMFCTTLDINNRVIFTVTRKVESGILIEDKRGKANSSGLHSEIKNSILEHIKSFPVLESHYCRSQTSKVYIDGNLNLSIMHRLYVEKCKETNKPFVKKSTYAEIFKKEFNISFHRPKKDQCFQCEAFKNLPAEEKENAKAIYENHQSEKQLSRDEKERDKMNLQENVLVACFDLEAVLTTPRGEISQLYYKRRLGCYNFTIFDMKKKEGYCYFWHEGLANRGSNEIGSCLYDFIKQKAQMTDFIFYADNCSGQNKNKFVTSLLLYCVQSIINCASITLKFLIVGHTQNEGDAMHARIEDEAKRVLRSGPIYVPNQWFGVLKCAKKSGKPYHVHELGFDDVYDLKNLSQYMGSNFNIDVNGEKVLWQEIKSIMVKKEEPYSFFYKTSYSQSCYTKIDIRRRVRESKISGVSLKKCYKEPVGVTKEKKKDLIDLCKSRAIPDIYHFFYENL